MNKRIYGKESRVTLYLDRRVVELLKLRAEKLSVSLSRLINLILSDNVAKESTDGPS